MKCVYNMEDVAAILKKIIMQIGMLEEDSEISMETNLVEDLNLDSINLIDMLVEIENTLDIQIDDNLLTFDMLSSFEKLVDCVLKTLEYGETNESIANSSPETN